MPPSPSRQPTMPDPTAAPFTSRVEHTTLDALGLSPEEQAELDAKTAEAFGRARERYGGQMACDQQAE